MRDTANAETDNSPRSQGYANGRVTKQAIVERAADAFGHKGFYGASLRSIAREAGIDHSTLLHHFGNKTALLLAVIEWHDTRGLPEGIESAEASLTELKGLPLAELAHRFEGLARLNTDSPGLVQLLSILTAEAGAEGHPARAVLQRRHDLLRDFLADAITRGRAARGSTRDPLSPEDRAAVIIATWEGLQTFDALQPGEVDVPTLLGQTLRAAFELTDESR